MAKQTRPTRKAREKTEQNEFVKRAKEIGIDIVGNRVFVTTSRQITVECMPVAHVIEAVTNQTRDEFTQENPEPEIPTFKIEGVPGQAVEQSYDATTILGESVSDEDKEKWAAHEAWDSELRTAYGMRLVRTLATLGTQFDIEESWDKQAAYLGLDVPEDEYERLMFYFTTYVVGNQRDSYTITQGIYAASGFNEALSTTIDDSFQS